MISDSSWSIVEHYRALEQRSELIQKDLEIDSVLEGLFTLYRAYSQESGLSPRAFSKRAAVKQELKIMLGLVYQYHAEAMKIMTTLRRCPKESRESFGKLGFLAPFSDYTAHELDDMLDWDDSYVLQAVRFLEEEVRARSLEQVTLIAALAGALSGVLAAGLISALL